MLTKKVSKTTLTDKQRLEVIKHRNENPNKTHDDTIKWIKNIYNLDIYHTTIGRLLKRKNDIKEGSSSKRIKPVQHKELNYVLEDTLANHNAMNTAIPRLKILLAQYNLQDIYNMDKTALFYHLEPDITLATTSLKELEINEGIGVNTENLFTTTNELSDLELQITKE
ncbi:27512_t:CDS:2, partial [Dentiscutata erythropus]